MPGWRHRYLLGLLILVCASSAQGAAITRSPGTISNTNSPAIGTVSWSSPSNATASDNSRASAASIPANLGNSQWLYARNFGFTVGEIPDGSVITGISVTVEGQRDKASILLANVRLVPASGTIPSSPNRQNTTPWGTSDNTYAVPPGSTTDTWGVSWSAADIRDADFGVAISVQNTHGSSTNTALIDHITITVYTGTLDRVHAAGFDSCPTGSISGDCEGWAPSTSGAGSTVTVSASGERTGLNGLHLKTTTAGGRAEACNTTVDGQLDDRAWSRVYLTPPPDGDLLAVNKSSLVASVRQCNGVGSCSPGVIGCFAKAHRAADGTFSIEVGYQGREAIPLNYGTFDLAPFPVAISSNGVGGVAFVLGQYRIDQRVACELGMEVGGRYTPLTSFLQDLVTDCSGGACDIIGFCLGTPASGALPGYVGDPLSLTVDDAVLDTIGDPGLGRVHAAIPNANGSTNDWARATADCSNTNHYDCIDDWATGAADTCTGVGTQRSEGAADVDLFGLPNASALSPAINAADVIRSVRGLSSCCSVSNTVQIAPTWRVTSPSTTTTDGATTGVPDGTNAILSHFLTRNFTAGTPAWTSAAIDSLEFGTKKTTTTGTARCTADLVYIDVQTPSPKPDWHFGDVPRCVGGANKGKPCAANGWTPTGAGSCPSSSCAVDGEQTLLLIGDSVMAASATGTCKGGGTCQAACTTSADCPGGGTCTAAGVCNYPCEVNDDCQDSCDSTGVCANAAGIANQLAGDSLQAKNVYNCGLNRATSQWVEGVLPAIMADPRAFRTEIGGPCKLVRGRWGACASGGAECTVDSQCDTGTCEPFRPDVVLHLEGANTVYATDDLIGECTKSEPSAQQRGAYFPSPADLFGYRACPQVAATPGPWVAKRVSCSTDANCANSSCIGPGNPHSCCTGSGTGACGGSLCMGFCDGFKGDAGGPATKPCLADAHCSYCPGNTLQGCDRTGQCVSTTPCTGDADCPDGETCNENIGKCKAPTGDTCNDPSDCDAGEGTEDCVPVNELFPQLFWHNCGDESGAPVCTVADCDLSEKFCTAVCGSFTCASDDECTGGGTKGLCVSGRCTNCGFGETAPTTSTAIGIEYQRRLMTMPADGDPDALVANVKRIHAVVEAYGAAPGYVTYGPTSQRSGIPHQAGRFILFAESAIRGVPHLIDAHNAMQHTDDPSQVVAGVSHPLSALLQLDGIHLAPPGADQMASMAAATLDSAYPICRDDSSTNCGWCYATCAVDADCGVSPADCVSGQCRCAVAGGGLPGVIGCPLGSVCADIDHTAGTDLRCVTASMASCPVGDSVDNRKFIPDDSLCASGACNNWAARPQCTRDKNLCSSTAGCDGQSVGDVCNADGAWQPCRLNVDCRDGAAFGDPFCVDGVCQYAPTSTPTRTPTFTQTATATATGTQTATRTPTPGSAFVGPNQTNDSGDGSWLDWLTASGLTTGANAGGYAVTACEVYIDVGNDGDHFRCGLYAVTGGTTPSTLLCESASTTITGASDVWAHATLSGCGTLAASTVYAVAFEIDSNAPVIGVTAGAAGSFGAGGSYFINPQTYGTFPSPWSGGSADNSYRVMVRLEVVPQ